MKQFYDYRSSRTFFNEANLFELFLEMFEHCIYGVSYMLNGVSLKTKRIKARDTLIFLYILNIIIKMKLLLAFRIF